MTPLALWRAAGSVLPAHSQQWALCSTQQHRGLGGTRRRVSTARRRCTARTLMWSWRSIHLLHQVLPLLQLLDHREVWGHRRGQGGGGHTGVCGERPLANTKSISTF